jgi:hypothetical protein
MPLPASPREGAAKLAAAFLVVAVLVWPEREVLCPRWDVRVLDGSQRPVAGVTVRRSCQSGSFHAATHEDSEISDGAGRVTFDSSSVMESRLQRWSGRLLQIVSQGAPASSGPRARIVVAEGSSVSEWTGVPERMDSQIVVTPSRIPPAGP